MAKSKRLGLIAAMTVFSATSLPQSSYAQGPPTATGTWTGTESFTITDYYDSTVIGQSSGSNVPAELTLQFYIQSPSNPMIPYTYVQMGFTGFSYFADFGLPTTQFDEFNSQGAQGFTTSSAYHYGTFNGEFSVTYQADFADGFIDTTGGTAFATAYILDNTPPTSGYYDIITVSFQSQSVPEPSSLALAASGLLALLVFAGIRCFSTR
jgi:PEP-CTERM motif